MNYQYKMIQIPMTVEIRGPADQDRAAAMFLEEQANTYADRGWSFFRVDTVGIYRPPGCLGKIFGWEGETTHCYVMTFRKPREQARAV